MNRVHLTGWREGFDKIATTKTIRAHLGLDLAAAKRCTDDVLEGKPVTLEVSDTLTARSLAHDLEALGVKATLELGPTTPPA